MKFKIGDIIENTDVGAQHFGMRAVVVDITDPNGQFVKYTDGTYGWSMYNDSVYKLVDRQCETNGCANMRKCKGKSQYRKHCGGCLKREKRANEKPLCRFDCDGRCCSHKPQQITELGGDDSDVIVRKLNEVIRHINKCGKH